MNQLISIFYEKQEYQDWRRKKKNPQHSVHPASLISNNSSSLFWQFKV